MGIPDANKQCPMTMENPVTLLDHTLVVPTKHKLVPSAYVTKKIKEGMVLEKDKADDFPCMGDLKYVLGEYGTGE